MKLKLFVKTAICLVFPVLIMMLSCDLQRDRTAGLKGSRPNILIAISDDQSFPAG